MLYFPLASCCVLEQFLGIRLGLVTTLRGWYCLKHLTGNLNLCRSLTEMFIAPFPPVFPFESQHRTQGIYYFEGGMGGLLLQYWP